MEKIIYRTDRPVPRTIKIGIIGAGVTGLSVARKLSPHFATEILEAKNECGGIARTRTIDGIAYHTVGGHCFNSKYPEVLNFVFGEVLAEKHWKKVTRQSAIRFHNHEIPYPIEFSIRQIAGFDRDLAIRMTADFLNANDNGIYANLDEWFRKKFGHTLAEEYFIPYNRKIWNRDPAEMSAEWVADKLPIPDRHSFFDGLTGSVKDSMPHAEFYYPLTNNQNTFTDALAEGLNITYDYEVNHIRYEEATGKWKINQEKTFDLLISTMPLDILPHRIEGAPESVRKAASRLKYNRISNILWKSRLTGKTWTYLPENGLPFHRYIHIGSYFTPAAGYTITEAVGTRTDEELVTAGRKDPFLLEPIASHVSDHAYVVFDENYYPAVNLIQNYLQQIGLYSIGRFGEWQYYNMDVCIKRSLEFARQLIAQAE